jgi:aryl-alcohol dehydrogenase-like predicted oxidoreductase
MKTRTVGDHALPPIGLGTMLMTLPHPPPGVHEEPIPEAQAIRTIHAGLDAGVRLLDTAINYCMAAADMGRNERLVAKALDTWSGDADAVLVACKGGNRRTDDEPWVHDGTPENLRWSCETSLRALGVESLGLYLLHAPDPAVPVEESVGALAELQAEGKIQLVGVSNFGRRQLATAQTVVDVAAVENNLAPARRGALPLAKVCEAEGIGFLAWAPLGGQLGAPTLGDSQPAVATIAAARGISPQVVALAWCLAQADNIIPIPSARRPETILDSVTAWDLELTTEELASIDANNPGADELAGHRLGH